MTEPKKKKNLGINNGKMGRPLKEFNRVEFEKLCNIQCTRSEIEAWFGATDKTLNDWVRREYGEEYTFSVIYEEKKEFGKISLRRAQRQMAEKNVAMAIFLGKNILGQSDKQEIKSENTHKIESLEDYLKAKQIEK